MGKRKRKPRIHVECFEPGGMRLSTKVEGAIQEHLRDLSPEDFTALKLSGYFMVSQKEALMLEFFGAVGALENHDTILPVVHCH